MAFAAQVREATRSEHATAQSSVYFDALLAGRLDRAGYAALATQLYVVYETLEAAATAMRTDPVAGAFVLDELTRLPALADDLADLLGPDWAERIVPSQATIRYRDRLREVAFTWPAGFVAHHYTRYLGDLSGGQIMRRVLSQHYGLDGAGASFYDFPGVNPVRAKQHYRQLLDAAAWSAAERERFLGEVRLAYQLNTAMIDDLVSVVNVA